MRPSLAALLVCLAGCSGFAATEGLTTPTGTVTPAPVPGDLYASTPAITEPPGLRDTVDARTLARRHMGELAGSNYTWVVSRNHSAPAERDAEWVVESLFVRVVGPTEFRARETVVYRQPGLSVRHPRAAMYADGETVYVRGGNVSNSPANYTRYPARRCTGG